MIQNESCEGGNGSSTKLLSEPIGRRVYQMAHLLKEACHIIFYYTVAASATKFIRSISEYQTWNTTYHYLYKQG